MIKKVENIINLVIGIIILNNLYYLTGLLGTSSLPVILLCLLVSIAFFIKSFNKNEFVCYLNNWNSLFYLLVSIPLGFIDFVLNGTIPVFNDFIRVCLYLFYFSWSFSINSDFQKIKKWFVRISATSIIVLLIQGVIENSNPVFFSVLLSTNVEKRVLSRIAGTLIDSNSYAAAICSYSFILFYEYFPKKTMIRNIVLFFTFGLCFYLTDLAGSRQGLLMLLVFFFLIFFVNLSIKKIKIVGLFVIGVIFTVIIMFNSISNYVAENPSSSIARLFFSSENERSLQSNLDRTHSLEDGIKLIADNYFIYGPGTLNFASRWASFSEAHEPHNGFLFLLTQFGILGFIPIFILYLAGKRAYISQVFIFYLTLIIHFSLQPNEMYYGNMFLCLFYIDTKYYFLNNENISL